MTGGSMLSSIVSRVSNTVVRNPPWRLSRLRRSTTPGSTSCVDPLYRKAIRTSMGASLQVPFGALPDWPRDLEQMRALGVFVVALTTGVDAPALAECLSVVERRRVALVLGHEGSGLSGQALEHADARARIPMAEDVDSLNVATAAGIALYALFSRMNARGGTINVSD